MFTTVHWNLYLMAAIGILALVIFFILAFLLRHLTRMVTSTLLWIYDSELVNEIQMQ